MWTASRAARAKITVGGIPDFLIYCDISTVRAQSTIVATSRGFGAHGVEVVPVASRCKDITTAPRVENA